MGSLGLEISSGKSVISMRFTEFAKKLKGPSVNFTPIGAGAILSACRSGYMFPALFRAAIGSCINSVEELLELVRRVPAGLVSRRDLSKFVNLVLWQFFGPSGKGLVKPAHFGALALEWVSDLPKTSSLLVDNIFDSINTVNMKLQRQKLKESHLPMTTLLVAAVTVTVSKTPFLRVLETLMTFVNPGFWIYFLDAILYPIRFWENFDKLYQGMPIGPEGGYMESLAKLIYLVDNIGTLSVVEFPLTKVETKLRATFLKDILADMNRRHNLAAAHPLHIKWYELQNHYGPESLIGLPDLGIKTPLEDLKR
jgi:hypothetical protein